MDRREYESRIRALDDRLESSLEVLRSAHRVERRALDFLWMTSPANAEAGGQDFASLAEVAAQRPAPPAQAEPLPSAEPAARNVAEARPPRRWRSDDLLDQVLELLDEMPEVFDRDDFLQRLGEHPPERSMLYRVLQRLSWEGQIVVVDQGGGRKPVRYRRADLEEEDASEE